MTEETARKEDYILEPIIDSITPPVTADQILSKVLGRKLRIAAVAENAAIENVDERTNADGSKNNLARVRPVAVIDVDLLVAFQMITVMANVLLNQKAWLAADKEWREAARGNLEELVTAMRETENKDSGDGQ